MGCTVFGTSRTASKLREAAALGLDVGIESSREDVAERRDAAARVLDLLETLPASQREVIRLKFQNGFSYREISRISGHSVTHVGYLIHTGLKTLRGQLNDGPPARANA